MLPKRYWSKISLIFLLIVAIIGTLLRSNFLITIPLKYANLVHAHSHVAFQGWVYLSMFVLLLKFFLQERQIKQGTYATQFILTMFVIVGVLVSFSLQGYALYSIIFSTLFQILSYWFIHNFLRDAKANQSNLKSKISLNFIKMGLFWAILSSLVPFGIGALSAKGMAGTEIYHSLVYTFLHLQYNAWFLSVALGLFYQFLEKNHIPYQAKFAQNFYLFFNIAIIPAISLSLLGMSFAKFFFPIAYISAILQTTALIFFLLSLPQNLYKHLQTKSIHFHFFFWIFLLSFVCKILLQNLSVFPFFKSYAFQNKFIILAYLHLSLIGVISFLLLALMLEVKYLLGNIFTKLGTYLLLIGFLSTEVLLVLGGLGLFYSHWVLALGSASMALGILFLIIDNKNQYFT